MSRLGGRGAPPLGQPGGRQGLGPCPGSPGPRPQLILAPPSARGPQGATVVFNSATSGVLPRPWGVRAPPLGLIQRVRALSPAKGARGPAPCSSRLRAGNSPPEGGGVMGWARAPHPNSRDNGRDPDP